MRTDCLIDGYKTLPFNFLLIGLVLLVGDNVLAHDCLPQGSSRTFGLLLSEPKGGILGSAPDTTQHEADYAVASYRNDLGFPVLHIPSSCDR